MARRIHVPDAFDTTDGGELPFSEVHQRFALSHLGRHLSEHVRYSRYKPEGVSNRIWQGAPLGADVNNMRHMKLTGSLTRQFLLHQDAEKALNHTDSQILMLAAYVHDWVEGVVGDITYDCKTATDTENEAQVMLFLLNKIFGNRLSRETMMRVYRTVKDDSTRLGEIFNAIERVGYMRTGLNAWEASNRSPEEESVMTGLDSVTEKELRENLQWLASNVAGNQTQKLLQYAEKYAPVSVYMGNVRGRISHMFQHMPITVFQNYPEQTERFEQMQKFANAAESWNSSKFTTETTSQEACTSATRQGPYAKCK